MAPGLAKMAARAGTAAPFAKASDLLADLAGIQLTAKRVERSAEAGGTAVDAAIDAETDAILSRRVVPLPPASLPDMLHLAVDGTRPPVIPTETEGRAGRADHGRARTREVKLACLLTQTRVDADGRPGPRPRLVGLPGRFRPRRPARPAPRRPRAPPRQRAHPPPGRARRRRGLDLDPRRPISPPPPRSSTSTTPASTPTTSPGPSPSSSAPTTPLSSPNSTTATSPPSPPPPASPPSPGVKADDRDKAPGPLPDQRPPDAPRLLPRPRHARRLRRSRSRPQGRHRPAAETIRDAASPAHPASPSCAASKQAAAGRTSASHPTTRQPSPDLATHRSRSRHLQNRRAPVSMSRRHAKRHP
jgi:hypothetical protein